MAENLPRKTLLPARVRKRKAMQSTRIEAQRPNKKAWQNPLVTPSATPASESPAMSADQVPRQKTNVSSCSTEHILELILFQKRAKVLYFYRETEKPSWRTYLLTNERYYECCHPTQLTSD